MNNNSKAAAKRTQVVLSAPAYIKIGTKEVVSKSGVKRTVGIWRKNQKSHPIKEIVHNTIPGTPKNKAFNQFKRFKKR